jgi:hypothetical protein
MAGQKSYCEHKTEIQSKTKKNEEKEMKRPRENVSNKCRGLNREEKKKKRRMWKERMWKVQLRQ